MVSVTTRGQGHHTPGNMLKSEHHSFRPLVSLLNVTVTGSINLADPNPVDSYYNSLLWASFLRMEEPVWIIREPTRKLTQNSKWTWAEFFWKVQKIQLSCILLFLIFIHVCISWSSPEREVLKYLKIVSLSCSFWNIGNMHKSNVVRTSFYNLNLTIWSSNKSAIKHLNFGMFNNPNFPSFTLRNNQILWQQSRENPRTVNL